MQDLLTLTPLAIGTLWGVALAAAILRPSPGAIFACVLAGAGAFSEAIGAIL